MGKQMNWNCVCLSILYIFFSFPLTYISHFVFFRKKPFIYSGVKHNILYGICAMCSTCMCWSLPCLVQFSFSQTHIAGVNAAYGIHCFDTNRRRDNIRYIILLCVSNESFDILRIHWMRFMFVLSFFLFRDFDDN